VQGRLVGDRTGQHRGAVLLVGHAQPLEPLRPTAIKVTPDPDSVYLTTQGMRTILSAHRVACDRCLSGVLVHVVALLALVLCLLTRGYQ
jgi:hypothetical protein